MLYKAIEALDRALVTIETRMPEDFISMDLQEALSALGEITGDSVDDEIIEYLQGSVSVNKEVWVHVLYSGGG